MSFSKRQGLIPNVKQLQIDSIDKDLKNSLWNVLLITVFKDLEPIGYNAQLLLYFKKDFLVEFFKKAN
jgi:hypothetical protein